MKRFIQVIFPILVGFIIIIATFKIVFGFYEKSLNQQTENTQCIDGYKFVQNKQLIDHQGHGITCN